MWLKVIGYTCRTIIIVFLISLAYTLWFLSGKPTITVDYLAKFNEEVRPDADESLNAAPYYLKAIELYVDPDPEHDLRKFENLLGTVPDPQERRALRKWLQNNQQAIHQLRLATSKPHCWFKYDVRPHSDRAIINIIIPPLNGLRQISLALSWQMQFNTEKGNWELPVADFKSAKTLARHLMGCPTLIEQLVGTAVDQRTNQQLMRILRGHTLPPKTHQDLALILAESFPSGYPIADIGRELANLLDIVQRVFTDDGSGDGHLIPFAAARFMPALSSVELSETPISFVMAMVHSSRRKTVQLIEQWKQMTDGQRLRTPYQDHIAGCPFDAWFRKTLKENPRNYFIKHMLPATSRAVWVSYIGQAHHDAARTVIALLRYNSQHGQFPDSLEQLVPQYLKAVPGDPFGPGLLSYKRQGDDFILYSWGLNFTDDAGRHNAEAFRQPKSSGDYVFWPPEPTERKN